MNNNQDNKFDLEHALAIAAITGGLYKGTSTIYKDYKSSGGNIKKVFTGRKPLNDLDETISNLYKPSTDLLDLNKMITLNNPLDSNYISTTIADAIQKYPDIFKYSLAQAKLHANYLVNGKSDNFLNIYSKIANHELDYSNVPHMISQLRDNGILDSRTEQILTRTLQQHYRLGERFEDIVHLPKLINPRSLVSNKTLIADNTNRAIHGITDSFSDALSRHGIEFQSTRVRSTIKDKLVKDVDEITFKNLVGHTKYDINIPRASISSLKMLPPDINVRKGNKYWLQDVESGLWFHKSGKVAATSKLGGPGRFTKNTTNLNYSMLLNRIKTFNRGNKGVLLHGHYYALGEFLMPTTNGLQVLPPDAALYQHLTNVLQETPVGTNHAIIAQKLQDEISKIVTSGELIPLEYTNSLYKNSASNLTRRIAEQRVTALGFMKRSRGNRYEFDYDAAEQALLQYTDSVNPKGLFFHGSAGKVHRLTASRLNAASLTIFGEGQPLSRGLGTELVRPYTPLPEVANILSGDLPGTNTSYFKRGEDFLATDIGRKFWKQSGVSPIQSVAMYLADEQQMTKYGTSLIQTLAPDGSALGLTSDEFIKAHSGFSTTDIKLFAPEGSPINPRINELLQSGQSTNIPIEHFGDSLGYDIGGNIVTGPRNAIDTRNFVTGVSRIADTNELRVHIRQEFTPKVSMKLFPSKMNVAMRHSNTLYGDIESLTTPDTARSIMDTITGRSAEIVGSGELLKTRSALLHQMTSAYFLELDANIASNTSRNLKLIQNSQKIASGFAKSINPEHAIIRQAIEHLPAKSVGLIGAIAYAKGSIDDNLIRSLTSESHAESIIQELRKGMAVGLVTGRTGGFNITGGSGVRASLEPRNIMGAMHNLQSSAIDQDLPSMFRELLGSHDTTTNNLMKTLKSVAGKVSPEINDIVLSHQQAYNIFRDPKTLGEYLLQNKSGFWVNMEGTQAQGLLGGQSHLFVPGSDLPGMDIIATAQDKYGIIPEHMATNYRDFIIHHASSKSVEQFKSGFNEFQKNIYNELIYSIYGLSEGRRAGALRGKIPGSRYLQGLPHSVTEYHTELRPGSGGIARDSFLEAISEMRSKGGKYTLAANQYEALARAGQEVPIFLGRHPATSSFNQQARFAKVLWDTPENAHFITYNPMMVRANITPVNAAGVATGPQLINNEMIDIGAAAGLMGDFDNDHYSFLMLPGQEGVDMATKLARRQIISDNYMQFVMTTQALKKATRARSSSISVEEVRMRRMRGEQIHPTIWQNAMIEDIHSTAIVKRKTGLLSSALQQQKALFLKYADEDMLTRAGQHEALWHHIEQETISSKKGLFRTKNDMLMADAIIKHLRDNNFQGLLSSLQEFTGINDTTYLRYNINATDSLFNEFTKGLSPNEIEQVRKTFNGTIPLSLKQLVKDTELLYNRSRESPFMTVGNTGSDTLIPSAQQLRNLGIDIGDEANLAERALARLGHERIDNPLLEVAGSFKNSPLAADRSLWHLANNEITKIKEALHGPGMKWIAGGLIVGGILAARSIEPHTDLIPEPSIYGMHNAPNIPTGMSPDDNKAEPSVAYTKKGYINAGVNGQNIKANLKGEQNLEPEEVAERIGQSIGKTKVEIRVVEDKRGLTPERINDAYNRDSYMEY